MSHTHFFGPSENLFSRSMMILYIVLCFVGAVVAAGELPPTLDMPMISREDLVEIAGYGEAKLSTVLVTGSVLCGEAHSSINGVEALPSPQPISGALVAVNCQMGRRRRACWTRGETDENGEFSIDLPSHLHATPLLHRKCSVRLLQIPKDSQCGPTYLHGKRRIKLSSIGDGVRTYSTGSIKLLKPKRKPSEARVMNISRSKDGEAAD